MSVPVENPTGAKRQAPSFKLEIPENAGVKARLMSKLSEVREKLVSLTTKPVNHADILKCLLYSWLKAYKHAPTMIPRIEEPVGQQIVNSQLYAMTKASIQKLTSIVENLCLFMQIKTYHQQYCSSWSCCSHEAELWQKRSK